MSTIEIENAGPVAHLQIPVPAGGGLVVLRGRNGSGKSQALNAVETLVSGRGKVPVRDNAAKATVEGFGARLSVGKSTRRSGELEVASLEGRLDVSALVDPGLKDEAAADGKRIRALIGLTGAKPDLELFRGIFARSADFDECLSAIDVADADLVTVADRIKRHVEAKARTVEAAVEKAETEGKLLVSQAGEVPADAIDLEELRAGQLDAAKEQSKAEQRAADAKALAERRRSAEAALKAAEAEAGPDVDVEGLQAVYEAAQRKFIEARMDVEKLAEKLAAAKSAEKLAAAKSDAASEALEAGRKSLTGLNALRAALESIGTPPKIDPTDTAFAAVALDAATEALENGLQLHKRQEIASRGKALLERARGLKRDADELRSTAAGTDQVLSDAVAAAKTPLKVDGGRLVVQTDKRGATLFSELSAGEKWRIALDVAIEAVGADGLIVIRQEAFEALDPDNRAAIAEHLKGSGVVCLTAEADGGELRAELENA